MRNHGRVPEDELPPAETRLCRRSNASQGFSNCEDGFLPLLKCAATSTVSDRISDTGFMEFTEIQGISDRLTARPRQAFRWKHLLLLKHVRDMGG